MSNNMEARVMCRNEGKPFGWSKGILSESAERWKGMMGLVYNMS